MLTNYLRSRRKQKLTEELRTNPQPPPEAFIELVQILREDGDVQGATKTAKMGAELYPDSANILESQAEMERVVRQQQKERLLQKIDSYPNPILYARLAELYKTDHEIDAAVQVCQEGIRSFPRYGGTYLVLGEICLQNGDHAGARAQLEKAVELDKYNYQALRLLADVYMALEMPAQAARRLEEILYFAPGDEAIVEMLARAREAAGEPPPDGDAVEALDGEEEPMAEVLSDVDGATGVPAQEQEINEAIGGITAVSGVDGALLVDPYGLVIAADLGSDIDEELVGAMITNVFRAVS